MVQQRQVIRRGKLAAARAGSPGQAGRGHGGGQSGLDRVAHADVGRHRRRGDQLSQENRGHKGSKPASRVARLAAGRTADPCSGRAGPGQSSRRACRRGTRSGRRNPAGVCSQAVQVSGGLSRVDQRRSTPARNRRGRERRRRARRTPCRGGQLGSPRGGRLGSMSRPDMAAIPLCAGAGIGQRLCQPMPARLHTWSDAFSKITIVSGRIPSNFIASAPAWDCRSS